MPADPDQPAFYAKRGGRGGDLLTLLHPPYTAWHLSYFALGAACAPHLHVNRLLWGLLAFLLAVGVSAHALDELNGRPLGTALPRWLLILLAALGLGGALAIGLYGALTVSVCLIPLVLVGGLLVPAYNLELFEGRFHSDLWFALAWGAFPAFTGCFVNTEKITIGAMLIALGCMAISVAQRQLSTQARLLRRRTAVVSGTRVTTDGASEPLTRAALLAPLEHALGALSLALVVTSCALIAYRL